MTLIIAPYILFGSLLIWQLVRLRAAIVQARRSALQVEETRRLNSTICPILRQGNLSQESLDLAKNAVAEYHAQEGQSG